MQVAEQAANLLLMSQVCSKVCLHLLLVLVRLIHSLMRFLQEKGKHFAIFRAHNGSLLRRQPELMLFTYQQFSHSSRW